MSGTRHYKPGNTEDGGEITDARMASPQEPSEGARPYSHLDFRFLVSKTVR